MARVCSVCGKGTTFGHNVSHSNRRTNRRWVANLKRVHGRFPDGKVRTAYVCVKCLICNWRLGGTAQFYFIYKANG